ncbi:MAG: HAMP domain-containing histidine kinase [Hyphomicrobiales bacterium]|nr:HAMP domain-containing histidine kinase [Hyphomicrobiales bacterium]
MKITHFVHGIAATFLLLTLGGVAVALWISNSAKFHDQRTTHAHRSYELHLQLKSNIFQLFKQYGDAILMGNQNNDTGEAQLIDVIQQNISDIRAVIGDEIELVGDEEVNELERLANIEAKTREFIAELRSHDSSQPDNMISRDWQKLSEILNSDIDHNLSTMINTALNHELKESNDAGAKSAAHLVRVQRIAFGFAIMAILIALLVFWVFQRHVSRPLTLLRRATNKLSEGEFDTTIRIPGQTEIAKISQVLEKMAEKVRGNTQSLTDQNMELEKAVRSRTEELQRMIDEAKTSEANRRRLLADVSHELRTPLTIIQGESDIALRGQEKSPEEYREALKRTHDAATHTAQLVNDLLFISRQETGAVRLEMEEFDLHLLIDDTLNMVNADVIFETSTSPTTINADRVRLRQGLIALLQNAQFHGGGAARVSLDRTPSGYRITVEDKGPGMTDAEREHAFERFFRGSNASHAYSEGTGLGLPVVLAIAKAHGGTARLENAHGGGTLAVIELPKQSHLKAVS